MANLHGSLVAGKLQEIIQTVKDATDHIISGFANRFEGLQHGPKEFKIGIFGPSGHGKTSLIEALVNEPGLLHINCHRASTSVINKILWNDRENSRYRSEILFLSPTDWRKQVDQWLHDLSSAMDEAALTANRKEDPAAIAFASLKTVYPYITKENIGGYTTDLLMQDDFVQRVLGTTLELECQTAEELRTRTKMYIDAKEKRRSQVPSTTSIPQSNDRAYWPLIRVVHTYLKSPALETGCAIVDLPGMRDSNAARDVLAERHIQQCDEVWIVADINRAEDDSVADLLTGLLGEKLKRQLYLDGNLHHVRFICTKTDTISVDTARVNFEDHPGFLATMDNLTENRTACSERLETIKTRIFEIKIQLEKMNQSANSNHNKRKNETIVAGSSKRIRTDSVRSPRVEEATADIDDIQRDSLSQYSTVSSACLTNSTKTFAENIDHLTTEKCDLLEEARAIEENLAYLDQQEWLTCVQTRNAVSTLDIQEAFAANLRDLAGTAPMLNTTEDENRTNHHLDNKKIPVHCVSSEGFRDIKKRSHRRTMFRESADTGIPSLVEHLRRTGQASAELRWSNYTNEVGKLLTSLWLYVKRNEMNAGSVSHNRVMSIERLNKFIQDLKSLLIQLGTWIWDSVNNMIICRMPDAVLTSVSRAMEVLRNWQSDIRWNTFKSIMQREGVWSNSKSSYDLNSELANIFLEHLTEWPKTFVEVLPSHLDQALQTFAQLSKDFNDALTRDQILHKLDAEKIRTLQDQVTRLHGTFNLVCNEMRANIEREQKSTNRQPQNIVRASLKPTYSECAADFGTGILQRTKHRLLEALEHNKEDMYRQMQSDIGSALTHTIDQEKNILMTRLTTSCDLLTQDYKVLFGQEQRALTHPGTKNEQHLIELIIELGALLRFHKVDAQEEEREDSTSTSTRHVDTTGDQGTSQRTSSIIESSPAKEIAIKVNMDSDTESD